MIRPTLRAVFGFVVGIPLALFVVIYDPALWPLSFTYGLAALLVIASDIALALPARRIACNVTVPDPLYIGERGAITVAIAAAGIRRAARFEAMAEQRGDAEPAERVAGDLGPGAAARIALPLVPRRRGRIEVDAVWLRWRGPLSLVELRRRMPVNRVVDVLPNVRGVHGTTLQLFVQEAIYGIKTQMQKGEGAEFEALREYAPGFDSRFIDWKHSARHHKLVCKEFRSERNHQLVMAFDTGHLMLDPVDGLTRLDHAINAALVLAWVSLHGGDLVGTFGFDARIRHFMSPVRGVASFPRLHRGVAGLDYHFQETNFTLGLAGLNARLKRRALVILFTDFVDTITAELLIESMQRVANRHLVLFVTQRLALLQRAVDAAPRRFVDVAEAVIAQDFLRERRVVFERLERLGIHCLEVPSRGLPVALVNRYLTIKRRGLI